MNRILRCSSQVIVVAAVILMARVMPAFATVGWLPVSADDLALKDNPKEPGADAMILYREVTVDARKANISGDSLEEYVRIKIFTQAGTKYGHIEIPYDQSFETIPYAGGRTILPDGTIKDFDGQVLNSTLVRTGGVEYFAKTFTLPDVQPGCIIEYRYDRQARPGWLHDEGWTLSSNMYTREAHFTYYPNDIFDQAGYHAQYRPYLLPAGAKMKENADHSYAMELHDIAAIVDEPLMPPKAAMEPSVEFYYVTPGEPDPTDPPTKFWSHYAKQWSGEISHFTDKKDALNQEISKILSAGDSPEMKLRKIYARVEQIRNLSMEDYRTQKETKAEDLKPDGNVADVLERGYATGHQINLTFIGLARAAGFDATEVFVAPRNTSLFIPNQNDIGELSAELVWVKAGSQEYYLDPSARYFPFGVLPWYESEAGGIRVDGHTPTIITTPNPSSSQATIVRTANLTLQPDNSISATVQIDFTGLEGGMLRYSDRKDDQTGRTKDLESRIKDWLPIGSEFSITKIDDWDDIEKPLRVEGTLKLASYGSTASRDMLLPLDIFQATQAGDFAEQTRHNAVYFQYPYQEIDTITVNPPPGYKIEAMPKPQKIDLKAAVYDITVASQGNSVEVNRHLTIDGVLFAKEAYPTFRAFFGLVRTNDNAQMVLENTQTGQLN